MAACRGAVLWGCGVCKAMLLVEKIKAPLPRPDLHSACGATLSLADLETQTILSRSLVRQAGCANLHSATRKPAIKSILTAKRLHAFGTWALPPTRAGWRRKCA